eukprot:2334435-Amphidinium_carterae.1
MGDKKGGYAVVLMASELFARNGAQDWQLKLCAIECTTKLQYEPEIPCLCDSSSSAWHFVAFTALVSVWRFAQY